MSSYIEWDKKPTILTGEVPVYYGRLCGGLLRVGKVKDYGGGVWHGFCELTHVGQSADSETEAKEFVQSEFDKFDLYHVTKDCREDLGLSDRHF